MDHTVIAGAAAVPGMSAFSLPFLFNDFEQKLIVAAIQGLFFAAVLAVIGFFLNRRLERFKLRQGAVALYVKHQIDLTSVVWEALEAFEAEVANYVHLSHEVHKALHPDLPPPLGTVNTEVGKTRSELGASRNGFDRSKEKALATLRRSSLFLSDEEYELAKAAIEDTNRIMSTTIEIFLFGPDDAAEVLLELEKMQKTLRDYPAKRVNVLELFRKRLGVI